MDIVLPRILPTGPMPEITLARPKTAMPVQPAPIMSTPETSPGQTLVQSFSSVLAQAMHDVNQLQQTADAKMTQLASGEPVDLHEVMISLERASVSFSLALQVRNKLIEAYQEVMRMAI